MKRRSELIANRSSAGWIDWTDRVAVGRNIFEKYGLPRRFHEDLSLPRLIVNYQRLVSRERATIVPIYFHSMIKEPRWADSLSRGGQRAHSASGTPLARVNFSAILIAGSESEPAADEIAVENISGEKGNRVTLSGSDRAG